MATNLVTAAPPIPYLLDERRQAELLLGVLQGLQDRELRMRTQVASENLRLTDIAYREGPAPGRQEPQTYKKWLADLKAQQQRVWNQMLEEGLGDVVHEILVEKGLAEE